MFEFEIQNMFDSEILLINNHRNQMEFRHTFALVSLGKFFVDDIHEEIFYIQINKFLDFLFDTFQIPVVFLDDIEVVNDLSDIFLESFVNMKHET